MPKINTLLISVLLLGVTCLHCAALDKSIHLASAEYPPYYGLALSQNGVLAEIIVESYRAAGYTTKISFQPFSRSLQGAKDGKYDGMFALWYRENRAQWLVFSDPISHAQIGIYKLKNNVFNFKELQSFNRKLVGVGRGYAIPADVQKMKFLKKIEVKDNLTNLQLLLRNRIDIAIVDKNVATYLMENVLSPHTNKLAWDDTVLWHEAQYLALSKKAVDYQEKLRAFNEGLSIIEKNGLLQSIKEKHQFDCGTLYCFENMTTGDPKPSR